ncbi:MAG: hydantoinase/oxoprolinase family protein [Burkholderiales bacterium]
MSVRIGVDIGGSFTDFAVLDEQTREVRSLKVFSRPDSPGSEVAAGMRGLAQRYGVDPRDVTYFTHGTTVGVNAVLQRKGLRLALITTRGFEDVLELARLKIPDTFHLMSLRPRPLVPRDRVFGVGGRLNAAGGEEAPVDEGDVLEVLGRIGAAGCEGVVVSLLHAYRDPAHERRVKEIIQRAHPGLFVSCSHEVWPIIREYERTSTAVIGAYVQPKVAHYLTELQAALARSGVGAELKVTKSNGGVMSAEHGKSDCVQIILSGTASGVIGASYIADQCGIRRCMSLDVGGTSADVALITDGQPQFASGERIGDFQIHIPSVSVTSIGDGGGSIAWVDAHGVLKVGPHSAGSSPGPVCYRRGGDRPTITDAFAVMGVLGHAALGYDSVTPDVAAAREAIAGLAVRLGHTVEKTAEAIVRVSISSMYAGVSRLVSRFGVDPREFTLLPFGGAGPMLACYLARELEMPRVLVPTTPGVLSALGGLIADTKNDFVKTTYYDLDAEGLRKLRVDAKDLEARAREWMSGEIGSSEHARIRVSADMRYRGQSFEVDTPLSMSLLDGEDPAPLLDAFSAEHARLYGHSDDRARVQVVALRLVITARTPKPALPTLEASDEAPAAERTAPMWLDGERRDVPVYRRAMLLAGQRFAGPAVVVQDDATTCVLPGFGAGIDRHGNLVLTNLR